MNISTYKVLAINKFPYNVFTRKLNFHLNQNGRISLFLVEHYTVKKKMFVHYSFQFLKHQKYATKYSYISVTKIQLQLLCNQK